MLKLQHELLISFCHVLSRVKTLTAPWHRHVSHFLLNNIVCYNTSNIFLARDRY